jgi:predicted O-methyltransferase YrrM
MRYSARVAGALIGHPVESITRIRQRHDLRRFSADNQVDYGASDDWLEELHARLELPGGCPDAQRFDEVHAELERSLPNFPYADDADAAFARALWCIARHARPAEVVETGVARGVSSRFLLEALASNASGRLWSVDLPPLMEGFHESVGTAVPDALRERWTYIRGPSRRELPRLLEAIGPIDMFVQDSVGTRPTVLAELELAWNALRPQRWMVVNAVNRSDALAQFLAAHGHGWHVVARAAPKAGLGDGGRTIVGQFAILRR